MLTDPRQLTYEAHRKWMREQWAISDEEDWCARKEVTPGTYKPLMEIEMDVRDFGRVVMGAGFAGVPAPKSLPIRK